MELSFSGSFEVGMQRAEAFELLSDPQKYMPVLPNFHSMELKDGDGFSVRGLSLMFYKQHDEQH